ncbi:MAG: hypothetical protein ACP5HX_10995 [Thermoproteota archaeon]
MTLYILKLTVAANSTDKKEVRSISGTVDKVGILWPKNVGGLLFAKFTVGNIEIPKMLEGLEKEMTMDDIYIEIPIPAYTLEAGEVVGIYGRNIDTSYEHSVYLYVYTRE